MKDNSQYLSKPLCDDCIFLVYTGLQVWQMSSRSCVNETEQSVNNVADGTVTVKVISEIVD